MLKYPKQKTAPHGDRDSDQPSKRSQFVSKSTKAKPLHIQPHLRIDRYHRRHHVLTFVTVLKQVVFFRNVWKNGRDWLRFEANKIYCDLCIKLKISFTDPKVSKLKSHAFISGISNFKVSPMKDHEEALSHVRASAASNQEVVDSVAGKALISLNNKDRERIARHFRNAHTLAKKNRPLSDFIWMSQLDRMKCLDVEVTYINHAADIFVTCIGDVTYR